MKLISRRNFIQAGLLIATATLFHSTQSQDFYYRAKGNESMRQDYFNFLLENRNHYGMPGWESFNRLVYDPGFQRLRNHSDGLGIQYKWPGINQFRFMQTIGQDVYIDAKTLLGSESEHEILSGLDNESYHANHHRTGRTHIGDGRLYKNPLVIPSRLLIDLIHELYSFDKQFIYIQSGKRKVSQKFVRRFSRTAQGYYKILLETANKNDIANNLVANEVLETLKNRPTLKLFTGQ